MSVDTSTSDGNEFACTVCGTGRSFASHVVANRKQRAVSWCETCAEDRIFTRVSNT